MFAFRCGKHLVPSLIAIATVRPDTARAAAWWYEQAERLQHVSATLLDGPPISEPVPTRDGFVSARFLTSLLPKPNPKVGAKQEKVPAAPVHVVPTLVAGYPLMNSGRYTLVGTAWAGLLPLPASIAKSIGVNASLSQYTFGASAENMFRLSKMILTTSAGVQFGKATLNGAITAAEAKDSFNASTTLIHVSQGIQSRKIPIWANAMVLLRRGTSRFNISLEQTEFVRTDNMSDAQVPVASQVTVGYNITNSFQMALSEYIVPDRLIMPRVSLVYQYSFGKTPEPAVEQPKTRSRTNRPRTNKTSPRTPPGSRPQSKPVE